MGVVCFLLRGSLWLPDVSTDTHKCRAHSYWLTDTEQDTCWNPRTTPEKSWNLPDVIWKQNLGQFLHKSKSDLLKFLKLFGPPEKVKRSSTDVCISLLSGLKTSLMDSQNNVCYRFIMSAACWPGQSCPFSGPMSAGIGSSPPWPCIWWAAINNSWMDHRKHPPPTLTGKNGSFHFERRQWCPSSCSRFLGEATSSQNKVFKLREIRSHLSRAPQTSQLWMPLVQGENSFVAFSQCELCHLHRLVWDWTFLEKSQGSVVNSRKRKLNHDCVDNWQQSNTLELEKDSESLKNRNRGASLFPQMTHLPFYSLYLHIEFFRYANRCWYTHTHPKSL